MTISQTPYERVTSGQPLRTGDKAFIAAQFQHKLHQLMLDTFLESRLKQVDVARRAGIAPEVISRLFANAGNPQADTVAIVMAAMGQEIHVSRSAFEVPNGRRNRVPSVQVKVEGAQGKIEAINSRADTDANWTVIKGIPSVQTVVVAEARVG